MMNKLLVVTDSYKARLFEVKGHKIKTLINSYNVEQLNLGHDRSEHKNHLSQKGKIPGTAYDTHGDYKEMEREDFSKKLSSILYSEKFKNGGFEELVIIAEPKMLGALRRNLDPQVFDLVSREIPKDLSDAEEKDIEKYLLI
jgi:protein required for attachment to host cells